jgi:hypothetical protein
MQASQRLPAGTASFRGSQPASIGCRRTVVCRRPVVVKAAVPAQPASIPVKTVDGGEAGSVELALKVAPEETARGLVHRYLVYVQQNARAVRLTAPVGQLAVGCD